MGMHYKDNNGSNQSKAAPEQPSQGGGVKRRSILEMGGNQQVVSARASGESVARFTKMATKVLEEDSANIFAILPVDANEAGIVASCIIVAAVEDRDAYVYTLVLEDTIMGELADKEFQSSHGGRTHKIPQTAGDIYNSTALWDFLENHVARKLPNQVKNIHQVAGSSVPRELSYDEDNLSAVRHILNRATNALVQYRANQQVEGNRDEMNMASYAETTNFVQRANWTTDPLPDTAGLPVRRQVTISLTGQDRNSRHNENIVACAGTALSHLSGYISFYYEGINRNAVQNRYQAPDLHAFVPVFNITDTVMDNNIITPELQLLAISTSTMLFDNNLWYSIFRDNFSKKKNEINIEDLGGLGVDAHGLDKDNKLVQGIKVDTSAKDWNHAEFLDQYVYPNPTYMLHVPEAGDMTWVQAQLRDASVDPRAYQRLYESANLLTNNCFGRHFQQGTPMTVRYNDRVVLGYYTDKSGNRRDIRDIGYLEMMNLVGDTDPTMAIEYGDTFNQTRGPLEERLERRIEILRDYFNDSLRITGYAVPTVLTGQFLKALNLGLAEAGLRPRIDAGYQVQSQVERGNSGLLAYAYEGSGLYAGQDSRGSDVHSNFKSNLNNRYY